MALAVLSLLAPVIFVRSREPFERLVVILEWPGWQRRRSQ